MSERDYYPAMSQSEWERAPWNEKERPEEEFSVNVSYTIENVITISTRDYEGGEYDSYEGYYEPLDTSSTNWESAYEENGYHTIPELLDILYDYLKKEHDSIIGETREEKNRKRQLTSLMEECEGWEETDSYFEEA